MPDSYGKALGELVYRKRKAVGLTQTQLAEDAFGTSGKTRRISELENGLVANPHPKTIDPIIVTLKITPDELEACAKAARHRPDRDLDRAYREARNLIDALARQFEHANPDATLAELDEFLRAKAKEWLSLRERIATIEASETTLSNLKGAAATALANANFDEVDLLLAQAEDMQQENVTIRAVRRQAGIRAARGDASFLKGDTEGALKHYLCAAEFFRPFDENEMALTLNDMAGRIYEASLRSLKPSFMVAATLLEHALQLHACQSSPPLKAKITYGLGLVYRNASATSREHYHEEYLEKAITYSRNALSATSDAERWDMASIKIGLGNCLCDKARKTQDPESAEAAIDLFKAVQADLERDGAFPQLLAHACNNLGNALLERRVFPDFKGDQKQLGSEAMNAYVKAIQASEQSLDFATWGGAKMNLANLLAEKAREENADDQARFFLQIQSIAAYLAAIETCPGSTFLVPFAQAHCGLAQVLFEHRKWADPTQAEMYMMRAIASYEIAGNVFTEELHPERWANIQVGFGNIFASHALMDGIESKKDDLEAAARHFQNALRVFSTLKAGTQVKFCENALERIQEHSSKS